MAASDTTTESGGEMEGTNTSIDRPRLTPQGRTDPSASGSDETSPTPGETEKGGQPSKAEG